jgi:8-oxo-dGTP pyrophosphatase MutT (NUDIX family)
MLPRVKHSFNYYFLEKRLHPSTPKGYRATLILLIINKNKESPDKDKFVFVEHKNSFWGFPKGGILGESLIDSISEAIVKNLGEELGLKGVQVFDTKPIFKQKAYIFDIARQIYDEARVKSEREKGRPDKGKIYHLAMMEYRGVDKLPLEGRDQKYGIRDFRWVGIEEGRNLSNANLKLMEREDYDHSEETLKFNLSLYERVISAYSLVYQVPSGKVFDQTALF